MSVCPQRGCLSLVSGGVCPGGGCGADTPQAKPLGRQPPPLPTTPTPCPVPAGIHTPPCPVHAGIHTLLSSACWDTVNKQVVRIPLECILVLIGSPADKVIPEVHPSFVFSTMCHCLFTRNVYECDVKTCQALNIKNIGSKHDHFWFCSYSVWMYSTLLQNELGVAMIVASTQWYFCSGTEVRSLDLDQKVVRQVWLHRCGQWESHMFCDLRYIHIIFYLNFNRVNFSFRISISTSGASKNICLTSLTRAKCGTRSTLCWTIRNIFGSIELFAL